DLIAGVTSASVLFGPVPSNPLPERDSGDLVAIDVKRPNALYRTFRHCTGTNPFPDQRTPLGWQRLNSEISPRAWVPIVQRWEPARVTRHQATTRSPRRRS